MDGIDFFVRCVEKEGNGKGKGKKRQKGYVTIIPAEFWEYHEKGEERKKMERKGEKGE